MACTVPATITCLSGLRPAADMFCGGATLDCTQEVSKSIEGVHSSNVVAVRIIPGEERVVTGAGDGFVRSITFGGRCSGRRAWGQVVCCAWSCSQPAVAAAVAAVAASLGYQLQMQVVWGVQGMLPAALGVRHCWRLAAWMACSPCWTAGQGSCSGLTARTQSEVDPVGDALALQYVDVLCLCAEARCVRLRCSCPVPVVTFSLVEGLAKVLEQPPQHGSI